VQQVRDYLDTVDAGQSYDDWQIDTVPDIVFCWFVVCCVTGGWAAILGRMKRLAVMVIGLLLLSGCADLGPAPQPPPTQVVKASPTPASTPRATPTATAVLAADLVCESIPQAVAGEFHERSAITVDRGVIVKVGEGANPGENWWIVYGLGSRIKSDGRESGDVSRMLTNFLSDYQPSGELWIPISANVSGINATNATAWENIDWTGDALARGKAALAKAYACLFG
jgi:hypothetical protein